MQYTIGEETKIEYDVVCGQKVTVDTEVAVPIQVKQEGLIPDKYEQCLYVRNDRQNDSVGCYLNLFVTKLDVRAFKIKFRLEYPQGFTLRFFDNLMGNVGNNNTGPIVGLRGTGDAVGNYVKYIYFGWDTTNFDLVNVNDVVTDPNLPIELTYDDRSYYFKINGIQCGSRKKLTRPTNDSEYWLFGTRNDDGTPRATYSATYQTNLVRIYGVTFYGSHAEGGTYLNDNNIIADFVPVKCLEDNTFGMFDVVRRFYVNNGSLSNLPKSLVGGYE